MMSPPMEVPSVRTIVPGSALAGDVESSVAEASAAARMAESLAREIVGMSGLRGGSVAVSNKQLPCERLTANDTGKNGGKDGEGRGRERSCTPFASCPPENQRWGPLILTRRPVRV